MSDEVVDSGAEVTEPVEAVTESPSVESDAAVSVSDSAEPGVTDDAGASETPDAAAPASIPADFPSGLVLIAQHDGMTDADIAATITELGVAGATKYFGRLRERFLRDFNANQPEAAPETPAPKAKPEAQAKGKRDFLSPERLKAITDWHNDPSIADGLLKPLGETIAEQMEALRDELRAELRAEYAPVIEQHQARQQVEYQAKIETAVGRLNKAGFASKYGESGKRTPDQERAVVGLLQLASGVRQRNPKLDGDAAILYAHEIMNGGSGSRSDAVKSVQGKLVARSKQLSVAPSGGGNRPVKALTPEQEHAEKVARIKAIRAAQG